MVALFYIIILWMKSNSVTIRMKPLLKGTIIFLFHQFTKLKSGDIPSQVIKYHHIGVHVIQVISIWRIVICGPISWKWAAGRKYMAFCFAFIIHTVKSSNLLPWQQKALVTYYFAMRVTRVLQKKWSRGEKIKVGSNRKKCDVSLPW